MNIIALELVEVAMLAIILGVMIAAGRHFVTIAGRGWRTIMLAFFLLMVSQGVIIFEQVKAVNLDQLFSLSSTTGLGVLTGYILGFVLVSIELVRAITTAMADHRTKKMASALTRARTQLTSGQDLLRGVLKGSLSGVIVAKAVRDESGAIVDLACELMNGAAAQILGRPSEKLLGRGLVQEVPAIESEGLFKECASVIESGLPFNEEHCYSFAGSAEWLHTVVVKLGDSCAITFTNITARKQAEEQLRHAAHHDALTGLPNRAMFIHRLEHALHWAQGHRNYRFAVMFFDFDRFKAVNDSLGHEVGDALLMSIADRLRTELNFHGRQEKMSGSLPARLGGDEFVVLLDDIADAEDAVAVARRMQMVMQQPHQLGPHEVISTASIGVVTCHGAYARADHILRDADTAMYEAKRAGRSCYVVFDPTIHHSQVERRRDRAA